jgi:hypothetical protein
MNASAENASHAELPSGMNAAVTCGALSVIRFRPERRGDERDFGLATDYRAAERTVRVLDRNDSHRYWFRAGHDQNGRALLGLHKGNACSSRRFLCFDSLFNKLHLNQARDPQYSYGGWRTIPALPARTVRRLYYRRLSTRIALNLNTSDEPQRIEFRSGAQ